MCVCVCVCTSEKGGYNTAFDANPCLVHIVFQVCLYPFDLLYLNGKSFVREPFKVRRELLRKSFTEKKGSSLPVSASMLDITYILHSLAETCSHFRCSLQNLITAESHHCRISSLLLVGVVVYVCVSALVCSDRRIAFCNVPHCIRPGRDW